MASDESYTESRSGEPHDTLDLAKAPAGSVTYVRTTDGVYYLTPTWLKELTGTMLFGVSVQHNSDVVEQPTGSPVYVRVTRHLVVGRRMTLVAGSHRLGETGPIESISIIKPKRS